MSYHLFPKLFEKMIKIKETSFLFNRGITLMFRNCTYPKNNYTYQSAPFVIPSGNISSGRFGQEAFTLFIEGFRLA